MQKLNIYKKKSDDVIWLWGSQFFDRIVTCIHKLLGCRIFTYRKFFDA